MGTTYYHTANNEMIGEHTLGQSRIDYLTDSLGSIVTTVDQSLTVVSTARYKPYGADLATTGTMPSFGYVGSPGYRRTKLAYSDMYVRKRHLASVEGRWSTVDPRWPREFAYIYVKSNPTSLVDPSGLAACSKPDPCKTCRDNQDNGFPLNWPDAWYNAIFAAWSKYCAKCPNLDPTKFTCQIKAESNGNPTLITNAAESNQGLFQISSGVWDIYCKGLGPFHPGVFDPLKNIECAIKAMCAKGSPWHCSISHWGTHTGHNSQYDCCMRCK